MLVGIFEPNVISIQRNRKSTRGFSFGEFPDDFDHLNLI